MSDIPSTVRQMAKMLRTLDGWLEKAEAHAKARGSDPEPMLGQRLVFDQFSLVRQVQSACDAAKIPAARLAGITPPKHPDEEKTFAELHARIASTLELLDGMGDAALEGAAERVIALPFLPEGKAMLGAAYLTEFALPNFYFHVCHAYALMRREGVVLGKRDFIGGMTLVDA